MTNTLRIKYDVGILFFLALLNLGCAASDEQTDTDSTSPNGRLTASFTMVEGNPMYSLSKDGEQIIKPSALGISIEGFAFGPYTIKSVEKDSLNTTWEPVWDKNSQIKDHYNETTVWLNATDESERVMGIKMRLYDDGLAIRYLIPEQPAFKKFTIEEDKTTFTFAGDHTFWSANGENHNLGPAPLSQFSALVGTADKDENPDAMKIGRTGFMPTVLDVKEKGYMAVVEAAIYDHAYFNLVEGDEPNSLKSDMGESKAETPAQTSWRVVLIGDKPGDLVESNTIVNLNPECAIEDPSWIQPGKSVWDWRVWGYEAADGFTYGLNTPSHKRLIDFASENNIRYLLMDADWYGPEFSADADPTSSNESINIEENMAYAKSKDVGIILYLNDVGAKKFGLEKILKQFSDWGAAGVKYGFMTTQGQQKVVYTRKVVELCAKYKLTVNFHDAPVPPSGDRRTWPNLVTREYGHSQADAKKSYYPETVVNQVFINMITGPLDLCNGWFGFEEAVSRPRVFEKIPGTVAAEVAKLAALFSGIHVLPDSPEEYEKKTDLFDFIKTLPDTFDELKIIDGAIDEFVTVGRRKGENWYLGTLSNRDAREVEIDFSFLEEGATYKATLYADAADSHFENNQESYQVSEEEVKKGDVIKVKIAPGGGHAIRLIKQ